MAWMFRRKKQDGEEGSAATRAHMGQESSMYFDKEKGRWRERGKEHLEKEEEELAPPPKMGAAPKPEETEESSGSGGAQPDGPPKPGGPPAKPKSAADAMCAPPNPYRNLGKKPAAAPKPMAVPGFPGMPPPTAAPVASGEAGEDSTEQPPGPPPAAANPFAPKASAFGGAVSAAGAPANPNAPRAFGGVASQQRNPNAPRGPGEKRERPKPRPVPARQSAFGKGPAYVAPPVDFGGGDPEGGGSEAPPPSLPGVMPPGVMPPKPPEVVAPMPVNEDPEDNEERKEPEETPAAQPEEPPAAQQEEPPPPPAAASPDIATVEAADPFDFADPEGVAADVSRSEELVAEVSTVADTAETVADGAEAAVEPASAEAAVEPSSTVDAEEAPAAAVEPPSTVDAEEASAAAVEPPSTVDAVEAPAAAEAPSAPELDAPPPTEDLGPPEVGTPVIVKGRSGQIVMKDDSDLPFKVHFNDDSQPASDWFHRDDVQVTGPKPAAATEEESQTSAAAAEESKADAVPAEDSEAAAVPAEESKADAVTLEESNIDDVVKDAWDVEFDMEDTPVKAVAEKAEEAEVFAEPEASPAETAEAPPDDFVDAVDEKVSSYNAAVEEKVNQFAAAMEEKAEEVAAPAEAEKPREVSEEPEEGEIVEDETPAMAEDVTPPVVEAPPVAEEVTEAAAAMSSSWGDVGDLVAPTEKKEDTAKDPWDVEFDNLDDDVLTASQPQVTAAAPEVVPAATQEEPAPAAAVAEADAAKDAWDFDMAMTDSVIEPTKEKEAEPEPAANQAPPPASPPMAVGEDNGESTSSSWVMLSEQQAVGADASADSPPEVTPTEASLPPAAPDEAAAPPAEAPAEAASEAPAEEPAPLIAAEAAAAEVVETVAEVETLVAQVSTPGPEVPALQQELEKLREAMAELQQKLSESEAEMGKLRTHNMELAEELKESRQNAEVLGADLHSTRTSHSNLLASSEEQAKKLDLATSRQKAAEEMVNRLSTAKDVATTGESSAPMDDDGFELPDFVWSCGNSQVMEYVQKLVSDNAALRRKQASNVAEGASEARDEHFSMSMPSAIFDPLEANTDSAIKFLSTLSENDGHQIPSVVTLFSQHSSDVNMCSQVCAALENLTFTDSENRRMIVHNGGVEAVLGMMKQHQDVDATLLRPAVDALWNITFEDEAVDRVTATDGIERLLAVMRKHDGAAELQAGACAVLLNLAAKEQNRWKIVQNGGVALVAAAMQRHSQIEEVLEQGCQALYMLAYHQDLRPLVLAAKGGDAAMLAASYPNGAGRAQKWGRWLQEVLAC